MTKLILHVDDVPDWALHKHELPHSFLDHLSEAVHPAPDGKGLISDEEIMLRQQFDAALSGNRVAMNWLLDMIAKDNAAELAASKPRRKVLIDGVPYFNPLAPVLQVLRCIGVDESSATPKVQLAPWFEAALERHCPVEKLAPVKAWLAEGGRQTPRVRDRDLYD